MTRFALLAALAIAACTPMPAPSTPDATLAIANVTLVNVETGHLFPAQNVLIAGDCIQLVLGGAQVRLPAGVRLVDGMGKFLIPGLWDAHVHLSVTGPEVLPLFVAHGVTSVRDAGSRLDDVRAMRARIATREVIGPRIMTAGPILEGAAWMQAAYQFVPPDHPIWQMAPRVTVSAENAQAAVDSLVREGVDYIKARNVWGDDFIALADATRRAGIPLASHNPNRVAMDVAARAGLGSFEHAESIWGDFDTLSAPLRRRMFDQVAATSAMVAPTLMAEIGLVHPESTALAAIADTLGRIDPRNRTIPSAMRAHWAEAVEQARKYGSHPPGTMEKINRDVRAMNEAGIEMLAGTDVGGIPLIYPGSSLHDELELLVRDGGLSPLEALQSATRNPARFFGIEDEVGAIRPGRFADLVLLDANPLDDIRNTRRIAGVVLRGRYLDRQALQGLAAPGAGASQQR